MLKVNRDLLNVKIAINLMEFYLQQEKVSEFEGNFILKELEKSKHEIKKEIIQDFEEIFTNTMIELDIEDWWVLADSEDFKTVEKRCADLENYDSKLFEMWKTEMMEDI